MNIINNDNESKELGSCYDDPFQSENIESINFNISRGLFDRDEINMYSTIHFKNKNTTGKHKIKSNDFIDLVQKTQQFIDTIKTQP